MNRRQFLGTTASAVLVAGTMARGKVFGANDRVRLACAGLRWRGWDHVKTLLSCEGAEVAALCDVDANLLAGRAGEFKTLSGRAPKMYRDIRDVLADDDIDAVTLGTPNHWHVLAAIWAMQASKDVYVEKPISHTIWEGRQLVAAARQYGRVIQHGTQRRSEATWKRAVQRARSGIIGDIYMVRCVVFKKREAFNFPMEEPPPKHVDWTLWQGPAPEKPYSRNYVHYNWHWFWHWGNGELGNSGVHRTDLANWFLDKGLPVKVFSTGGLYGYEEDARQTPNTQHVTYTFADGTIMNVDIRGRHTNKEPGFVLLYGTDGHMADGRFYDKDGKEIPDEAPPEHKEPTKVHLQAFVDAVRAANPNAVPATVEQGHVAAAMCHMGNISYRLGRSLVFDPAKETFVGDEQANGLLTRAYREGFEVPKMA